MTGSGVLVNARGVDGRPHPPITFDRGRLTADPKPGTAVLDAAGAVVAPGFVDVQINGTHGHDFTSDPSSIWAAAARLPERGVTAFLPTIVSSAAETVAEAQSVLASGPPQGWSGARPLGLHCEGPVLATTRRGTHSARRLRTGAPSLIDEWGGLEHVQMVTLAPEVEGAPELIEALAERGVVVSLGHSDCTVGEAQVAFERGATAVTHLFNAMSGLHHRAPGLAAAALASREVFAGLIVDGIHVDPLMVRHAANALGPERLVLVTDAIAATGAGDGDYQIGEVPIRVTEGRAISGQNTLAGSVLTMDAAVRNLSAFTEWPLADCIRSATETPARLLRLEDRGLIESGAVADLVILDDHQHVTMTIAAGRIAFQR